LDRQCSSSPQRFLLAKFLAEWLDQRFTIPGTSIRIGLDPILGLIPGTGDMIANLAGSAIILIAAQYRLPKIVLLRMGLNVALNAMIGTIPVFGDIFSIWFRSNIKNATCSNAMPAPKIECQTSATGFLSSQLSAELSWYW